MNQIKILTLTANPTDTAYLQLNKEIREIKAELQRSTFRNRFELINEGAVRINELVDTLAKYKPQIVHFSGHGAGEHGLVLEDDDGKAKFVPTDALRKYFSLHQRVHKDSIRCVFLNACYSKTQAEALSEHIDCVIGMNRPIGDATAIKFAPKFYGALAEGYSFQDAFKHAKLFLELDTNPEAPTPIQEIRQGAASLFHPSYASQLNDSCDNVLPFRPLNEQQSKKLVIVLSATIDEASEPLLKAIVSHLQKISEDSSLTLTRIEPGSIKLILDGSSEGFERIEALVESGQLTELRGIPIQNLYYLSEDIRPRSPKGSGGREDGLDENSPFYRKHLDAEAAYYESPSIGNISISGNSNLFNAVQGNDNTISQNINQSAKSSDLESALDALAKLKEAIANTEALDDYDKSRAQGDVEFIEKQLKQPKPDKSAIRRAIGALKIAFEGVVALTEPAKKIAELLEKF